MFPYKTNEIILRAILDTFWEELVISDIVYLIT